jgi:hypothetical protein
MTTYFERYLRLEPSSDDWDLQSGFEAAVHDPVWFLARQWQMGEYQGEDASSPVLVEYRLAALPIQPIDGDPRLDPTVVPAEAIVESELDDWWTMGRRIRAGRRVAEAAGLGEEHRQQRFVNPTPPYEGFDGAFDGKALWHARQALGIADALFAADAPPLEGPFAWDSAHLHYEQRFHTAQQALVVKRHHGGPMDWHSADHLSDPPNGGGAVPDEAEPRFVMPGPLEYPGAPNNRWWQIEDADTDIGGYPPDMAHFATMLLVDLIYSHSDDWFLFPVTARAGHVATIREMVVQDSFGRCYTSADAQQPGLQPPANWSLFQAKGLDDGSLVLWHIAELPLESAAIERVQFGLDEHANLLWAVERVVDGREVESRPVPPIDDGQHPPFIVDKPSGDATRARAYQYIPGKGIVPRWHPYEIEPVANQRRFVQRGLADFSRQFPAPMPHPEAETLLGGTPEQRELHWLAPDAIPANGIEVERRWMLARDMDGKPVLWTQRQRKPLLAPPARQLRFDVPEETEVNQDS